MFCLTNTGFVQCYFLGSRKVCCTLLFNFSLFSNFCFACLKASQTSGLCSAFPSAPVESVTRFRKNFVLRVLPYKHRVCAVLFGSRTVCCTLLLLLIYVLYSLPHQHRACAVLFPSAPLKFTPFFSLFYSVCFFYACFAQQAPASCAAVFSRLSSNLHS